MGRRRGRRGAGGGNELCCCATLTCIAVAAGNFWYCHMQLVPQYAGIRQHPISQNDVRLEFVQKPFDPCRKHRNQNYCVTLQN